MSSHHIVRDAQEPALIIAGSCDFEQVSALLEWSPVVIVLEPYLNQVLDWGIKIDVICLPIAKTKEIEAKIQHQMPLMMLFQKTNALQTALEYLNSNQHTTVSIIADKASAQQGLSTELELIFYEGNYKFFRPSQGIFKKWVEAGTSFKIKDSPTLKTSNLEQNGNLWRAIKTGFVTIHTASQDEFWLGEQIT